MPSRSSHRATRGRPPARSPTSAAIRLVNAITKPKVHKPQNRRGGTKQVRRRPARETPDLEPDNQEESVVIASSPPQVHTTTDDHTSSPPPPPPPPNKRFIYEWKVFFDGEEIGAHSDAYTLASGINFEEFWEQSEELTSNHALSISSTHYRISTKASIGTKGGRHNVISMIKGLEDWPNARGVIETFQVSIRTVLVVEITATFSRYSSGKPPPGAVTNPVPIEVTASKPEKVAVRVSLVVDHVHTNMKDG